MGYNNQHTAKSMLENIEPYYRQFQQILDTSTRWDEATSTWQGIDAAADKLRAYAATTTIAEHTDMATVRFDGLVIDELADRNLGDGRAHNAGGLDTKWDA